MWKYWFEEGVKRLKLNMSTKPLKMEFLGYLLSAWLYFWQKKHWQAINKNKDKLVTAEKNLKNLLHNLLVWSNNWPFSVLWYVPKNVNIRPNGVLNFYFPSWDTINLHVNNL